MKRFKSATWQWWARTDTTYCAQNWKPMHRRKMGDKLI